MSSTAVLQPGEMQPEDGQVEIMLQDIEEILRWEAAYNERVRDVGRGVTTIVEQQLPKTMGHAALSSYVMPVRQSIREVAPGVYYLQ